jgi:hypothetical protein
MSENVLLAKAVAMACATAGHHVGSGVNSGA